MRGTRSVHPVLGIQNQGGKRGTGPNGGKRSGKGIRNHHSPSHRLQPGNRIPVAQVRPTTVRMQRRLHTRTAKPKLGDHSAAAPFIRRTHAQGRNGVGGNGHVAKGRDHADAGDDHQGRVYHRGIGRGRGTSFIHPSGIRKSGATLNATKTFYPIQRTIRKISLRN